MQQVSRHVHVETGYFACNLGLITTPEGNILVDSPMRPTDALKWRETVSGLGEVQYLVNTEEHPDHTTGSHFLPGRLVTHQKTRERLTDSPPDPVLRFVSRLDPEAKPLLEGYRFRLADVTFTDRLRLFLGGLTVELFHLPGHSEGGIAVFVPEDKVVFATDIVFHRVKSWLHEAIPSLWLNSLQKLRDLDVDVIVPGHGAPCTREYLEEQARVVEDWVDLLQSCIRSGLTQEEAMRQLYCPDPHPKQAGTPMTEEELNRAIVARLFQVCH